MLVIFFAGAVFSIEAGKAALTLNQWGSQSGVQLLFNNQEMANVSTNAVMGELDDFTALDTLLAGAPVHYEFVRPRTVAVSLDKPETSHTATTWQYSYQGWYYACTDFDLISGFVLTRSQRLAWNIGIAIGKIPPDQMYCTRDVPIPPGEDPRTTYATGDEVVVQAQPRKQWWRFWKKAPARESIRSEPRRR